MLQSADSQNIVVVDTIIIAGKHSTHEKIIFREIPFSPGDTINTDDTAKLALQAEQNLVNTSLFHFASVRFCDSGQVVVSVTERWYIWPVPFFNIEERNFNVWLRDMSLEKVTYGIYMYHENFRGRKEHLKLLFKSGYNQLYALSYSNTSLDKEQNWGISIAGGFEASHTATTSILTYEPQSTVLQDRYAYAGAFCSMSVSRRVGFFLNHKFSVLFESTHFDDSLFQINSDWVPVGDWSRISLNYQFRADHRNFKSYPVSGWYADLELGARNVIGLSSINETKWFLKSTSRKYFKLTNRWMAATGATAHFSIPAKTFFANASFLGYGNDFVRGYEYKVIPVTHFLIHRNNVKFALLPQKIFKLPLIKSSKFNQVPLAAFVNIFFDQGWSTKSETGVSIPLAGQWLAGYGIGLDFVTYYDKVFRIEFTLNRHNEKGVFLHFTAPV